jgi:excisionase family DNA binding protein
MTDTRAQDHVPRSFPDAPPLLTVTEAARELRCSKGHVHNIIHGKVPDVPPLPVLRIGRRVLIRHEGLKAWMLSVEENMTRKLTSIHR